MGLVALLFIPNVDLAHNIRISLAVCIAVIPLVYFLLFSTYVERMTKKLSILFANNRILSFLFKTILVLHEYRNNRPIILASLCLSIIAQYLIIICYIFLGLCLNIGLPISYYIPIVPVVFLATSLPISIGGLGVRESVLVYLLTLFNVDTQAAIALSLLYFLILVILTLPGGLILLSEQRAKTGTIVN